MSEIRLQSDIVRKFSELYPDKQGQLFHVSNERNNKIQAFQAAAIGIVNGVADLVYIEKHEKGGVRFIGIELKEPNSRHKVIHVRQQIEWARTSTGLGAEWRLCRTLEEAISCTEGNLMGLTIEDVGKMLKNNGKLKTIKF